MDENFELVDMKQFARAVKLSTRTMKRYKRGGKLPEPRKRMGRRAYWTWDQIAEWVKTRQDLDHGIPEGGNKTTKGLGFDSDELGSRKGQEGPRGV